MEETLESRYTEEKGETFTLPNGRRIFISKYDLDFFYQIRNLPASEKIILMQLTEADVTEHFRALYIAEKNNLMDILRKHWYFRETGDEIKWFTEIYDGMTQDMILKRCHSRKPLSLDQIRTITNFFIGDKSEVYLKDEP